jgi:AraC family transcriptional regulator
LLSKPTYLFCKKECIFIKIHPQSKESNLLSPNYMKVRDELGHHPISEGYIEGATSLFIERYLFQAIDRKVSGQVYTALITQFGSSPIREGEQHQWRSCYLPTHSLLVPPNVPTHWHYSGVADFAVFYFLNHGSDTMRSLKTLAQSRGEPIPFADALVNDAAWQLVNELQRGTSSDRGFMERLAEVMLDQTFRALATSGTVGINPQHPHFGELQLVLKFIHEHLADSLCATTLARQANMSLTHFRRVFQEALSTPPHRYILAARLEQARKLLSQSSMSIARISEECGFSSQSHLTACFRRTYALTPAKFRAQQTEQLSAPG